MVMVMSQVQQRLWRWGQDMSTIGVDPLGLPSKPKRRHGSSLNIGLDDWAIHRRHRAGSPRVEQVGRDSQVTTQVFPPQELPARKTCCAITVILQPNTGDRAPLSDYVARKRGRGVDRGNHMTDLAFPIGPTSCNWEEIPSRSICTRSVLTATHPPRGGTTRGGCGATCSGPVTYHRAHRFPRCRATTITWKSGRCARMAPCGGSGGTAPGRVGIRWGPVTSQRARRQRCCRAATRTWRSGQCARRRGVGRLVERLDLAKLVFAGPRRHPAAHADSGVVAQRPAHGDLGSAPRRRGWGDWWNGSTWQSWYSLGPRQHRHHGTQIAALSATTNTWKSGRCAPTARYGATGGTEKPGKAGIR